MATSAVTFAQVQRVLDSRVPRLLEPGELSRAAVMVLLRRPLDDAEGLQLILTRRTTELRSHGGQVCFPGGRIEPWEVAEEAALRETQEELGVSTNLVEVLGQLDDFRTVTGYHISPVVGAVGGDVELVPNPIEVARVFGVPLGCCLEDERWLQHDREVAGRSVRVWHFPYEGEDTWGATAAILRRFVCLLRRG